MNIDCASGSFRANYCSQAYEQYPNQCSGYGTCMAFDRLGQVIPRGPDVLSKESACRTDDIYHVRRNVSVNSATSEVIAVLSAPLLMLAGYYARTCVCILFFSLRNYVIHRILSYVSKLPVIVP